MDSNVPYFESLLGREIQTLGDPLVIRGYAYATDKAALETIITVAQAAGLRAYWWYDTNCPVSLGNAEAYAIVWGD